MSRKILLIFCVIIGILIFRYVSEQSANHKNQSAPNSIPNISAKSESALPDKTNDVPEKIFKLLDFISKNNVAPKGFIGGRTFSNREKRLPELDKQHQKIKYQEWDANPKIKGKNRGAERLITGSDHSAYYTNDHYITFIKINR